ncbi:phage tail tape measure protein, partial [Streptomyces sp. NPDC046928]
ITAKVADLAGTFDQDLTGTANAASQMIRTGLAKDGAQALDLLTRGFQSSADKAGDLVDTMNEYGTQFRKAGLDGATSIGLLNQAIRAGARDADVAADAIKEFSLRAIDGSESTSDGFKALGLNADDMAKKFAQGGTAANGVLDLTLQKLRGIKDPVKQSQTAVALFGTQAEDLGAALLAMDPSTAAANLGKVAGAAKQVGDTIRGNTSTQLAVLQRQISGAFGVVITSVVLPALNSFIAGVRRIDDVVSAVVGWFREWGIWLAPLGILIAGITLTMTAQAIAVGAVTAVFSVYRAAILAWAAVQRGAIAVQAAFNAVLSANPIGLVVTALLALGTA